MHVIISAHLDTIFKDPMSDVKNGIQHGTCDNLSGILAVAQLIKYENIHIEFTNDEESNMGGAKWISDHFSPEENFIIVVDVTDRSSKWKKVSFTVENYNKIEAKFIKSLLKEFSGRYILREWGQESEAWLYKEKGYSCLEIDVPVSGGLHNLHNRARVSDILTASEAIKKLVDGIEAKEREEIWKEITPHGIDIK